MPVTIDLNYTTDLAQPLRPTVLRDLFVTGDQLAHRFTVHVKNGGTPASLTGATVTASFVRSDGATVLIPGAADGDSVTVTLPASCYAVAGRFTLDLRVTQGKSITSVFYAEGALTSSATGEAVQDPAAKIPTYNELIDTVNGFSGELAGLQAGLSRVRPAYNLLDNSCFLPAYVVKQRGSAATIGAAYCIDRWKGTSSATQHEPTADGLKITHTGASTYCGAQQLIDPALQAELMNKTVTVAVCLADGSVYVKNGVPANGAITAYFADGNAQLYINPDTGKMSMRIMYAVAGGSVTVRWVALYEGAYTADTVPAYVPKGYTAELLACQRYLHLYSAAANRPASGIDCAPPMTSATVSQGTLTVSGTTYYYNSTEP